MTVLGHRLCRLIAGLLPAAAILYVSCPPARAGSITLWYNGNADQRDAILNQTGIADGVVYDDFIVPKGEVFTITGVFSNNVYTTSLGTTAAWDIRSGVSAGDGGTLVASGDGTTVNTDTGVTFNFGGLGYEIYTNQVNGLNVVLTAGTYWLAVADVSNADSFIVTTSGAGAIGTPAGNDGNSFFTSTYFGDYFVPTSDPSIEGPGTWDYSMGIVGTASFVPEPSSLILGLIGLISAAGCVRARRRSHS